MVGATGGPLSPRPAAATASAAAAALITPRHSRSPSGVAALVAPYGVPPSAVRRDRSLLQPWVLLEKPPAVSLIGHPHGARKCPRCDGSYGDEGDLAP